MRMDADEYLEDDLINEINASLADVRDDVVGLYIRRKYFFMGKWIRHGAIYPLKLLRIWRNGVGRIEKRWMDEHIVLDGYRKTLEMEGHIVDDNLNGTKWWTDKHNKYADREMLDILSRKYGLFSGDDAVMQGANSQAGIKRFVKENIYNHLPFFVRPMLFFLYRYFLRFGFLDGIQGFAFHFFQGFWYRALVDLRVYEAEKLINSASDNKQRLEILEEMTGLKLAS